MTDEQIADAKKWAEGDKGAANAGCTFDAEALATAAAKRRDDAVAAKKAEEEAAKRVLTSMYFCPIAPIIFAPSRQLTMSSRTNANCPILAILLSSSFPSARP